MFSKDTTAENTIVWTLGLALAYGAFAQGAFDRSQLRVVLLLVLIAVIARLTVRAHLSRRYVFAMGAFGALAAWALLRAGLSPGSMTDAFPIASVCLMACGTLFALTGLKVSAVETLHGIVILTGVLVAATCWIGIVFHYNVWAMPSQGLWRGSSTFTYANSTAAFLAAPLFLSIRRAVLTPQPAMSLMTFVIGLGWLLTLSRAGVLSLAVGMLLVTVMTGFTLKLWPVFVAVFIAFVGVVPSMLEARETNVFAAVAAFVLAVAVLLLARNRIFAMGLIAFTVIGFAGVATTDTFDDAASQINSTRLNADSTDRKDLLRITSDQFLDAPLVGTGPGRLNFEFVNSAGVLVQAEFTHNEYLQIAAELGLVGLVLVILALAGLFLIARNSAIALAIVTTYAIHSGLDFLWHIPITLLVVVVCIARTDTRPGTVVSL